MMTVGMTTMTLTRSFHSLVQKRALDDPAVAKALLQEAVTALLIGEVDVGKALLRDYITATVGFEKLSQATGTGSESLVHMLGPHGNPQARDLFDILGHLQRQVGIALHVTVDAIEKAS